MKKSVRIAVYFLIEILYTLLTGIYLFYIHGTFGFDNIYSNTLFYILVFIILMAIWLIGPMLNRYIVLFLSFAYGLYMVAQTVYFRGFQQYFRFNTAISLMSEVVGVADSAAELIVMSDLWPLILLVIGNIIFIILYFALQRRVFPLVWRLPYKAVALLLLIPIFNHYNQYQALLDAALHQTDLFLVNESDYYIYDTIPNTNQFVNKFGLEAFLYRDGQSLFEQRIFGNDERQEVEAYLNSREPFKENAFTGIFKDKNVIFIQGESFNHAAVDEQLTPTIYKFKTEGINIENFNTPLLVGSTSDTEFMANLSIIPKGDGYASCYQYPFNTYKTTLASIFNDAGYLTNAFHNNYGLYYNRSVVLPSWGYQKFFDCTGIGQDDEIPDNVMGDAIQWIYAYSQSKWMAYWITYSGHQPYTFDSVGVRQEDVEKIKALYPDLDDSMVSYLAKNMDLDRSLQSMIELFRHSGCLDDVVFIFFGDHMAKGVDVNNCAYPHCDGWGDHTDLYIYNTQIEPMTISKYSTVLDLLPTVANLWGFKIDQTTVLGNDIFDEDYHGLYFSDFGVIRDNDYSYNYIGDIYSDLLIPQEEAEKRVADFRKKEEVSLYLLRLDYFKEEDAAE